MSVTLTTLSNCVLRIEKLSAKLPATIAEGNAQDRIYRLTTSCVGGTPFEVFVRLFDLLFKEDADCRDKNGRLHYIRRGKLGMGKFISYLKAAPWREHSMAGQHPVIQMRLERLIKELEYLTSTTTTGDETSKKPATKKAQAKKSNAKLATVEEYDEDDDEDYKLPEDDDWASEDSIASFTLNNGVEVDHPTGQQKRKRVVEVGKKTPTATKKKAKRKHNASTSQPLITVVDVDSDDEDEPITLGKKRGPSSSTREYFKTPQAVRVNGESRWQFSCKLCNSTFTVKRGIADTEVFDKESPLPFLGNLSTHLRNKHPQRSEPPTDLPNHPGDLREISAASMKIMENYLTEGKLNPKLVRSQSGFYRVFAAWLLEDDLPFTTGETGAIARLFHYLETHFKLPTDTTVRNTLAKLFTEMYQIVRSEIKTVQSRIACSTDTWSTKSMMFSFAGTIASWITEDWKLVERVVDFHPIHDKEHEGEYAAMGFAKAMSEMGVLEKINLPAYRRCQHIISLTLDNASSNNVLVSALSRLLVDKLGIQFVPGNSQIRCLNHILNLVVQQILATLNEAEDPDKNDYYDKSLPVHYSVENDPDQLAMEDEADVFEDEAILAEERSFDELLLGQTGELSPIQKLRAVCVKIISSPQRRSHFRQAARQAFKDARSPDGISTLSALMVVRDVATRWNYTHAMIKRALLLRKAIDQWVHLHQELWGLTISNEDWDMLGKLAPFLEPFTQVTLQMSKSSVPTLPWVLPMYEYMIRHLRSYIERPATSKTAHGLAADAKLRLAAASGLEKLNKYYYPARQCQFNVIATLLHPGLGYSWFQKLGDDRANQARTILEHAYTAYKEDYPPLKTTVPVTTAATSSFLDSVRLSGVRPEASQGMATDELESFLAVEDSNVDGLSWWKMNHHRFPIISRMARDFLAIPGTSVSVERLFSSSRHLCSDLRSSLKADTIMKSMLSKCWVKAGLLPLQKS